MVFMAIVPVLAKPNTVIVTIKYLDGKPYASGQFTYTIMLILGTVFVIQIIMEKPQLTYLALTGLHGTISQSKMILPRGTAGAMALLTIN